MMTVNKKDILKAVRDVLDKEISENGILPDGKEYEFICEIVKSFPEKIALRRKSKGKWFKLHVILEGMEVSEIRRILCPDKAYASKLKQELYRYPKVNRRAFMISTSMDIDEKGIYVYFQKVRKDVLEWGRRSKKK